MNYNLYAFTGQPILTVYRDDKQKLLIIQESNCRYDRYFVLCEDEEIPCYREVSASVITVTIG